VNRSINQTFSRTLLTSGTTLLAVLIMYIEGGTGIRPFTFAMLCGVVVGTYSTVAIAAPMVYSKKRATSARKLPEPAAGTTTSLASRRSA
jgi:preprotein translocase subunit SecF